jgi:coenzyme PQQ precursor peptide PqqA
LRRYCFAASRQTLNSAITNKEIEMTWEFPTAVEMRFGMEITMYVYSR